MAIDVSATLREAIARYQGGDIQAAEQLCRRALGEAPSNPDALHILALILYQLGDLTSARDHLEEAVGISPENPSYYKNMSVIYSALGQFDNAVTASRRVLELEPESADGLAVLGHMLIKANQLKEAEDALTASLNLRPDHPDAMKSLGQLCVSSARYSDAERILSQTVGLYPTDVDALTQYGRVLIKLQRYEDASTSLRKAHALDPSSKAVGVTLADALTRNDEAHEALNIMEGLLKQQPDDPDILNGIGHILRDLNLINAAMEHFAKALEVHSEHADAHVNIGLTQLSSAKFEAAWDHYHYRSQQSQTISQWPTQAISSKDASELLTNSESIVVWTEQGLGDEILQASLVPDAALAVKKLTLICSERLTSLFEQSFPGVTVMTPATARESGALTSTDATYPLLSLGKTLRGKRAHFPNRAGYLHADQGLTKKLRSKYESFADGTSTPFVVSISWISGHAIYGRRNTIPLQQWLPVFQVAKESKRPVVFIAAQYGASADEVNAATKMSGIKIHVDSDVDHGGDLQPAAGQLAASDLIISTSTTTAQLAAALGRPVWHLPSTGLACGWYWLTEGETTPWYPSMRQFRRTETYPDGKQLSQVAQALGQLLKDRE